MLRNLMVLGAALATIAAAAPWRSYSHPEAGFTIEAPEGFVLNSDKQVDGARTRLYGVRSGDLVFGIVSTDASTAVPASEWAQGEIAVANAVADGAAMETKEISRTQIAYPGGGAVEVLLRDAEIVSRTRILVRRPWVLHLAVIALPEQEALVNSPEADRFLNSAKVVVPAI